MSPYAYAAGNPMKYTDLDGRFLRPPDITTRKFSEIGRHAERAVTVIQEEIKSVVHASIEPLEDISKGITIAQGFAIASQAASPIAGDRLDAAVGVAFTSAAGLITSTALSVLKAFDASYDGGTTATEAQAQIFSTGVSAIVGPLVGAEFQAAAGATKLATQYPETAKALGQTGKFTTVNALKAMGSQALNPDDKKK